MRTAKDIMTRSVISIRPEADVTEAARLLLEAGVNGLPVLDDFGTLVGIVCQSDLVRMQKSLPVPSLFTLWDGFVPLGSSAALDLEVKRIAASKVADAMSRDVVSITPETALDEIASLMVDKKYHTLPVIEDGKLLGVVGKEDILKTLLPDA